MWLYLAFFQVMIRAIIWRISELWFVESMASFMGLVGVEALMQSRVMNTASLNLLNDSSCY